MKFTFDDIVITGYSAVTAAGNGLDPVMALIATGAAALTPIPDTIRGGAGHCWGKALSFKATEFMPPLKARKMDRCSQFAVAAAGLALKHAAVDMMAVDPERIGISLGCGFGGVANSAEFLEGYFKGGAEGLSPMLFPNTVSNAAASNASIEFGLKGPNVTHVQRFCSAESAILMACRFIEEGRADIMLTGGADDLIPWMIDGFAATGQLRRHAASFGEGSGILVIERGGHALQRGVVAHGRIDSIATVGLLPEGNQEEGLDRLLGEEQPPDLISLSGTAGDTPAILGRIPMTATRIRVEQAIGRSLAMGGTAIGALLASTPSHGTRLHLAASPEGPYYAIRICVP